LNLFDALQISKGLNNIRIIHNNPNGKRRGYCSCGLAFSQAHATGKLFLGWQPTRGRVGAYGAQPVTADRFR
jgi:hypothetical protein